jgi:hypothetical protein
MFTLFNLKYQYIEGENTQILSLFEKIKLDHRHSDIMLMSLTTIKEKIFPNWYMGKKQVSSEDIEYLTNITRDEKQNFENIFYPNEIQANKVQSILHTLYDQL